MNPGGIANSKIRGLEKNLSPFLCLKKFDTAVSQFGLIFFNERFIAISEMLRVLRPQGRLAVAVWDSIGRIPAYTVDVALLERAAGKRAADALRAPFVLGDRQALATLFEKAGTASIEITSKNGTARFPSIQIMVEANLRGWLSVIMSFCPKNRFSAFLRKLRGDLNPYINSDGGVVFESSAPIVTGTNP